jgi:uncharacterized secreted protein with C-terminal beta-propeller domain
MKLSVFDVSDPFAVRETQTLALDYNYSDAQYDHHAILASETDGLVGFPVTTCDESTNYTCETQYVVYHDGESGFALIASIPLGQDSYAVRGMLIDANLYIWNGTTLRTLTGDTFIQVAEITIL